MIERGVFRHGSRKEKPHRKWWRKKRFLLPGLFLAYVAVASVESAFVDHLVAKRMENRLDFDARYEEFKAQGEIYGPALLIKKIHDGFGYTHITYFERLKGGNTIRYMYLRPRKRLSVYDYLYYNSWQFNYQVAHITDPEIIPVDCPDPDSINKPIRTHGKTGVPFTQEYWTNPQGIWFKVPYGYWNRRTSIDQHHASLRARNPDNPQPEDIYSDETGAISFNFWMPSLRFPEYSNKRGTRDSITCEDGRPVPKGDEYEVIAILTWAGGDFPERGVFPTGFVIRPEQVVVRTRHPENLKKAPKEFGLTRLGQYGQHRMIEYIGDPNSNFQVYLLCSYGYSTVDTTCFGDFVWKDERIVIKLFFPYAKRAEWQAIVNGARTLLMRWRKNALSELNNFPNHVDKGIASGAWTNE